MSEPSKKLIVIIGFANFLSGVFIIQEMMLTPEWKVFSTHKSNVCTFKFDEVLHRLVNLPVGDVEEAYDASKKFPENPHLDILKVSKLLLTQI